MTRVREMSTSLCGDFSDFEAIVIRKSPVREEVHRASILTDNWEEEGCQSLPGAAGRRSAAPTI